MLFLLSVASFRPLILFLQLNSLSFFASLSQLCYCPLIHWWLEFLIINLNPSSFGILRDFGIFVMSHLESWPLPSLTSFPVTFSLLPSRPRPEHLSSVLPEGMLHFWNLDINVLFHSLPTSTYSVLHVHCYSFLTYQDVPIDFIPSSLFIPIFSS